MSESLKTLLYLLCAAGVLLLAWVARPDVPGRGIVDDKGEAFFPAFDDPLTAAALEIIEFDEETGTPQPFKVARHDGVWSIPSHENYPADAENQFAEATAAMIGLLKGSNVSDRPADHELYGVVDPGSAGPGATGVGKRITLTDAGGGTLADLIIGKDVKDSPGQRYVRVPGVDRVYLCGIDAGKFSTAFEDWIERDLLQLSSNEVTAVVINDYSIDEINRRLIQGETLELAYDATTRQWSLPDLAEDETLVANRLSELSRSLDDLEIVDVHRKPAGLSSELRTEDALQLDNEAVRSLQSRGYFIVQGRLLSNEGETIVRTDDGVQYTLRFGEIAMTRGGGEDETTEGTDETSGDTGRYLFVTAEFNPDLIPAPDIVELPDLADLGITDDDIPAGEGDDTQPSLDEAMQQAREKVEQDNARKQQEHQQKIDDGRQRARELNARFADWYYVISDPVYGKIRLRRSDIVEKTVSGEDQAGDTG